VAEWVRVDEASATPKPSSGARSLVDGRLPVSSGSPPTGTVVDPEVLQEVANAASEARPARRDYLTPRFEEAVAAYERGRDREAARLLAPLVQDLPDVASVRQLAGLVAYREGRWRDAVRNLEAYQRITRDRTYVPIVMDGLRAQGRRSRVADLWAGFRHDAPNPDVLAEARIVAAETLADGDNIPGGISLLAGSGAGRRVRNPATRHLRQWYVLADLYERAGDVPAARDFFGRVFQADPDFYDVARRLGALGGRAGPARSRRG